MSAPMRTAEESLIVDWTACQGRGLCVDLLPEILESDPWGFPKSRHEPPAAGPGSLAAIPDELSPHARRAVHMCPRLALRLEGRA
jgi:ferredoxin